MQFAICIIPVSNVRQQPLHISTIETQLLFGDCCVILEHWNNWLKIKCKNDGYEGWCQKGHVTIIDEVLYKLTPPLLTAGWVNEITFNEQLMRVPYGCRLTGLTNNMAAWGGNTIIYNGTAINILQQKPGEDFIKQVVFNFLNTSYQWGGKSVFATDCSGFVQTVYRFFGIEISRNANRQIEEGTVVNFLQEVQCGDLAFFNDDAGEIVHVGIMLNAFEIIHASVTVRVDKIDNMGIAHAQTGERTHQLRLIKRYF
jgi:gamma-D-glutamyl-L-lysine dipeptidyl-peptidase